LQSLVAECCKVKAGSLLYLTYHESCQRIQRFVNKGLSAILVASSNAVILFEGTQRTKLSTTMNLGTGKIHW
jgi:hypothetical protein